MLKKNKNPSILTQNIPASDAWAIFLCITVMAFWSLLLSYKYYCFGYYDWDLALYAHAMWNLVHGTTETSLFGMSFLGNHSNYIAFLIAPVYALFPHSLTLVMLKTLSSIIGGFILYRIAKEKLGGFWGNIFMLMFFLLPANYLIIPHEFDFESLAVTPLLLMYYFMQKRRFAPFIISAVIVASMKENLPLVVIAFGIYGIFAEKTEKWKWGGIPILIGAAIFCLNFFVVIPSIRQAVNSVSNPYLSLYSETASGMLAHPEKLIGTIATQERWKYLKDLFGPWITSAGLSIHILFLISPIFLQNILSSLGSMHSIFFHYNVSITPFIFLASINTFAFVKKGVRPIFLHGTILFVCFVSLVHTIQSYGLLHRHITKWEDHLDSTRQKMVDSLPKNAPVIATFEFLNELSARKILYPLYYVYRGENVFTQKSFPTGLPDIDYALIDFEDPWIYYRSSENYREVNLNLQKFFLNSDWKVHKAVENIVLFKRNKGTGTPLVSVTRKPPDTAYALENIGLSVTGHFSLLKYKLSDNENADPRLLPVTLLWKSLEDVKNRYTLRFGIESANGDLLFMRTHEIGYTIYPTFVWKEGEYILEKYWLSTPKLKSGNYKIVVALYDSTENKIAPFTQDLNGKTKSVEIIQLGTLRIP